MRISDQGRQQVRPRDFWLTVIVVIALMGGVGLYFMQTGRLPAAPPWSVAAFLLFLWAIFLYRLLRYGRGIYSPMQVLAHLGCTLLLGSDLVPPLVQAVSWLKNLGALLIGLSMLSEWVDFKKRPSPAP